MVSSKDDLCVIENIEYTYSNSNGDYSLFTKLLIDVRTKNYFEKHSDYYDGDQYNIFL